MNIIISNLMLEPFFYGMRGNEIQEYKFINVDDYFVQKSIVSDCDHIIVLFRIDVFIPEYRYIEYKHEKLNDLCNDLEVYLTNLLNSLLDNSYANIIWFSLDNCDVLRNTLFEKEYQLKFHLGDKINLTLFDLYKDEIRVEFIDTNYLIAQNGISQSFDSRYSKLAGNPYSKLFISIIMKEIQNRIKLLEYRNPKCIVVDGDNVLWGGILSEEGICGIRIDESKNEIYKVFQTYLGILYDCGVLLALCTQNDFDEIEELFLKNEQFVLHLDQFVIIKTGWETKCDKIKQIHEELDMEYSDMVFIDDSKFEVEQIKYICPEISTLLFNNDIIKSITDLFKINRHTKMTSNQYRVNSYKANSLRNRLKKATLTYEDYLESLKTQVDISICESANFCRIVELSHRTNRCTNGIRITLEEILKLVYEKKYVVCAIKVCDIFSDFGIVGALIYSGIRIKLCCLSCRVINRGIENILIDYALNLGLAEIEMSSTGKNRDFCNCLLGYFNQAS